MQGRKAENALRRKGEEKMVNGIAALRKLFEDMRKAKLGRVVFGAPAVRMKHAGRSDIGKKIDASIRRRVAVGLGQAERIERKLAR